ncbi:MAG: hypothetical protein FJ368_04105 [Pelagibacterales bacterium]|nr:hypothetical protein [Pelagibacterales bacterium]
MRKITLNSQQQFLQRNKDIFLRYVNGSRVFGASVIYDNLVINDPKRLAGIITTNSVFSFDAWAKKYFN